MIRLPIPALLFLSLLPVAVQAGADLRVGIYFRAAPIYEVVDKKQQQSARGRGGRFRIEDLSPFEELRSLMASVVGNTAGYRPVSLDANAAAKWKPEFSYAFGTTLKPESFSSLMAALNHPQLDAMLLVVPGIHFDHPQINLARTFYGNGVVYRGNKFNIFTAYQICAINAKSSLTASCDLMFHESPFYSEASLSPKAVADVREYIRLDITDVALLEELDKLLAARTLYTKTILAVYRKGMAQGGFGETDIRERAAYLEELLQPTRKQQDLKSLYENQAELVRATAALLKQTLPGAVRKSLDSLAQSPEPEE